MNANAIAAEIKSARAEYVAAKAETDRIEDMFDGGIGTDELEDAFDAACDAETAAIDRLVAALGRIGIDEKTARIMVVNPQYSERFDALCDKLAA